jgi:O-antigen ligase
MLSVESNSMQRMDAPMAHRASRLATVARRAHEAACFLWVAMLPVARAPESIAFFVLMVASAARIVVDPDVRGSFLRAVRVLLPMVLFCAWAMCASAWSPNEFLGAIKSTPLRATLGVMALVPIVMRPWSLLLTFAASSTVMLAIAAVRILANPTKFARFGEDFPGIVGSYSATCLVAGALLVGASALVVAIQQKRYAALGVIPATIAAFVLRAAGSRAGTMAAIVGAVITSVSLVSSGKVRRWRLVVAIALLLATSGALVWQSTATSRMLSILNGSPDPITVTPQGDPMAQVMARTAGVRGQIWFVSLSLISQQPVFGWGTKSWRVVAPPEFAHVSHAIDMKDPKTDVLARTPHAHNAFLHAWVEQGAIGVALLAWILISCWQLSRRVPNDLLRAVLLGMLSVWVCNAMTAALITTNLAMAYLGLIVITATAVSTAVPTLHRK